MHLGGLVERRRCRSRICLYRPRVGRFPVPFGVWSCSLDNCSPLMYSVRFSCVTPFSVLVCVFVCTQVGRVAGGRMPHR